MCSIVSLFTPVHKFGHFLKYVGCVHSFRLFQINEIFVIFVLATTLVPFQFCDLGTSCDPVLWRQLTQFAKDVDRFIKTAEFFQTA